MMDISRIDNAVHDGTLAQQPGPRRRRRARPRSAAGACICSASSATAASTPRSSHLLALIGVAKNARRPGRRARVPRRARRAAGHRAGVLGAGRARSWRRAGRHRHRLRTLLGDGPRQPLGARRAGYRAIVEAPAPRAATALEGVERSYAARQDRRVRGAVRRRRLRRRPRGRRGPPLQLPPRSCARAHARPRASPAFDGFARAEARALRRALRLHDDVRRAPSACPIAFPQGDVRRTSSRRSSPRAGLKQFRCAETEKYAHVTYFFNGGREEPFDGEDRKMLPSPKDVATYDKKPEMSAAAVADGRGRGDRAAASTTSCS